MDSLRTTAILVTALDRTLADSLLEHLSEEQADEVRQAVLNLDDVSKLEEQQAIRAFFASDEPAHSTVDRSAARGSETDLQSRSISTVFGNEPVPCEMSLRQQLEETSASLLARLLRNEQPQTIALALSEMEVDKASEVVSLLDVKSQAEILQRLVELDRSPDLESDYIRREFRIWLEELLSSAIQRSQLVSRLSTVVESASQPTRERILENLAMTDSTLAEDLNQSNNPPVTALPE